MHILKSKPQFITRLMGRVIIYDSTDPVPTLYWAPDFSIFCDGKGNEKHLWSLTDRPAVELMCQAHSIRFEDCSACPRLERQHP